MLKALVFLLVLVLSGQLHADSFYKWVDADGVTHYSEKPPAEGGGNAVNIDVTPAMEGAPAGSAAGPTSRPVTIYSAEWCGVCKQAKQYFHLHQVVYTEYDVEKSAKGMADFKKLHGRGVPIILVGNDRMDGFSPSRFEQMRRGQ
jgi:glutaredoxin